MIYKIALTLMILGVALALLGINGYGRRIDLWPIGWTICGLGAVIATLNLVWSS